jgi:hypothetical protein
MSACIQASQSRITPLGNPDIAEINTREHFTKSGVKQVPFEVTNPWFVGAANVSTYAIDELLCTKLRDPVR